MRMPPTNTGRIQAGQFRKGKSGNPSGKPKGARHQTTLAIEKLLEGEAEEIGRKAIELANAGDTVALRLCLERIPPLSTTGTIPLPQASCRCGTSFDVDRPPSGLDWLHVTVSRTKPKSRCRPGTTRLRPPTRRGREGRRS